MKRRKFLKAAAASTSAMVLPFMLGGYSIKAFAANPLLRELVQSGNETDHVFVLIQLIGGNDGLNTVIPLDQYSAMSTARANILIPENQVLKLTTSVGLHPTMSGLQSLFSESKLAIVQGVGYPQPNFSHFRSTDIWLTGSDYNQTLSTGWMGRFLDQEYPGYPVGYPNSQMPDPLAIQIGSAVSTGLEGPTANMGMAFSDPTSFYDIVSDTISQAPNTRAGHELTYIRSIGQQLNTFATPVKAAASLGTTKSAQWPAATLNPLADQMRIAAQLIAGGLKTRLYVVNLGGFDSHTNQRATQDPLLKNLSTAIAAFQDELRLYAIEDRVIGMTFSEFGRRIKSNDSGGTDHGAAAPLFVFGTKVVAGIHGTNPVLPANATVDDNVEMQYDFRSVYASVLKEWFGANDTISKNTLLANYPTLPIIQTSSGVAQDTSSGRTDLFQNYPNPFGSSISNATQIRFQTSGGFTRLRVFDLGGREVSTLVESELSAGMHEIYFNANGLASGTYLYTLESAGVRTTKSMVITR